MTGRRDNFCHSWSYLSRKFLTFLPDKIIEIKKGENIIEFHGNDESAGCQKSVKIVAFPDSVSNKKLKEKYYPKRYR